MNCQCHGCEQEAAFTFLWPGKWVRQAACLRHAAKATSVAVACGFKLELGSVMEMLAAKAARYLSEAVEAEVIE